MTRVQLAKDKSQRLSKHIEEFTQRSLIVLLFWTIAAVVISFKIDELLSILLYWLSPCTGSDCLNIYEPATWTGVRWSSVGILSMIATSPILLQQSLQFASPGLLPDERKWLRNWFIIAWLSSIAIILVAVVWLLPAFFSSGHSTQSGMGFDARYDAAGILRITFLLILAQVILTCACLWILLGSKIGIISSQVIGWWRLRIHGFTLGLLILLTQSIEPTILLLFIGFSAWILELCFRTVPKSPLSGENRSSYIDANDCEHQFMLVDCKCLGAMDRSGEKMDVWTFESDGLCYSTTDRDLLLQTMMRSELTDVVITGCDSKPLPANMHSSANFAGCKMHGLGLMDTEASLQQAWIAMKNNVLFEREVYAIGHND